MEFFLGKHNIKRSTNGCDFVHSNNALLLTGRSFVAAKRYNHDFVSNRFLVVFFCKKCDKNKVLYFDKFYLIFPFEPESFNQLNSYWTIIFDHAFDLIFNILIESTIKLADNLRNQLSITIALFRDCVCW